MYLSLSISFFLFQLVHFISCDDTGNLLSQRNVLAAYLNVPSSQLYTFEKSLKQTYKVAIGSVFSVKQHTIFPQYVIDDDKDVHKIWFHLSDGNNSCIDSYETPGQYTHWMTITKKYSGTKDITLIDENGKATQTKLYFQSMILPKTIVDEEIYLKQQMIPSIPELTTTEVDAIEFIRPVLQIKLNENLENYRTSYVDYNHVLDNIASATSQVLEVEKDDIALMDVESSIGSTIYQVVVSNYKGMPEAIELAWRSALRNKHPILRQLLPLIDFDFEPIETTTTTTTTMTSTRSTRMRSTEELIIITNKGNTVIIIGSVIGALAGATLLGTAVYLISKKISRSKNPQSSRSDEFQDNESQFRDSVDEN